MIVWVIVLMSLLAPSAWATTYYVGKSGSDANSCATAQSSTAGNRKLTIISGKGCLTAAGDTLIVGDGTYVEGEIELAVSGTSGNPITIRAENQHLAILSSTSSSPSCAPNISFRGSWLVIDGLRGQIDATDPSGCPNNSANGAFVRMWNTNDPAMGGNESTGHQGGTVRNCYVVDHAHRSVGIKSNQDYSLVENCTIENSLEGFNGIDQVFRNNTITGPDGWGDHFTCKGGSRNCQFYNNTIQWGSGVRAMVLGGNSSCCWWDASTHYECYNCVAYNNAVAFSASSTYSVGFQGCKNCGIYNNAVVGDGKLYMGPGADGAHPPQPWPDSSTIKNNIFSGSGNTCTIDWGSDTNTTVNYNNFYNCTSAPSQTNAITGDPLFVNPTSDWHLQIGSPALEAGTTATAVKYDSSSLDLSRDRDGYARRVQWDLGVYEDDRGGGGEPIMFISLAWLLFGIGLLTGSVLLVNGIQQISAKVPGFYLATRQYISRLWGRTVLRFAWRVLTRDQSRPSRLMREQRREMPKQQGTDHADRHHQ